MAHLHHGILCDIQRYDLRRRAHVAVKAGVQRQKQLQVLGPENPQYRLTCFVSVVPGILYSTPFLVCYPKDRGPEIPMQNEACVSPCLLLLQVFLSHRQKEILARAHGFLNHNLMLAILTYVQTSDDVLTDFLHT